jgi:nitrate reductase gamma subunit
VSRADTFFWVLLPYVALTSFVVGHVWRYRRDGYTWTARSTQLLERRLLLVGSVAFHLGMLGVIGGHVIGILIPNTWTDAIGVSHEAYHWIAIVAGGAAGRMLCRGAIVLVERRVKI